MSAETFGVLLLSGSHDRAHYAFSLAAGAAALGRPTVFFAVNQGARALRDDWSTLDNVGRDAVVRRRGLPGLGEMRESAREIGVRMLVCESGLKMEDIAAAELWDGVEIVGIATFLEATAGGQIVSL